MTKDIKAVIFDWGGVLIDDPGPGLMEYCARKLNVEVDDFINSFDKLLEDYQTNSISEDKFWELISRDLNVEMPVAWPSWPCMHGLEAHATSSEVSLWKEAFISVYKPKDEMFALVDSLRAKGYKTAILSNTEIPAMDFFIEQRYNCFDVQVFSCKEGTRKPYKKIYDIVIEKLECLPEQAIFIDDKRPMIEGAKKANLNAIHFQSIAQVKNELIELGLEV
ncbi:MAG: HAD family phosphatase [Sedimentisphaerales bacterium]|nr:HAD family phosphatase [Sedimentisphaerales bacterium]